MRTIHRSHRLVLAITTVVALIVVAPVAVNAEEQILAMAPATGSSWDATSGYSAVEASRADVSALLSSEVISGQEQALAIAAAAAMARDETSGYRSVEASRAAPDVYAAPTVDPTWDQTSGYGSVERSRAIATQGTLQSGTLGGGREAVLTAMEAASIAEDEASGNDALASNRADLLAQFRFIELSLSRNLGRMHSGEPSCNGGN